MTEYAELITTSNFTFLRGGSHPREFINAAEELGYAAVGLADHNTLAGIVRGHTAAKDRNINYHPGCRLDLSYKPAIKNKTDPEDTDRISIVVYPTNSASYANLCRLLTLGKRRASTGECLLSVSDYMKHHAGLAAILLHPCHSNHTLKYSNASDVNFMEFCSDIKEKSQDPALLSIALIRNYESRSRLDESVIQLSKYVGIPLLASNNAFYHTPLRRPLQDVLTCIRNKCSIEQAGFHLFQNAERYLKPVTELRHLFRDIPLSMKRTLEVSEMLKGFSLDQLKYEYPDITYPDEKTPLEHLRGLALEGAEKRYPKGVPEKVSTLLNDELKLIHELGYEKYFLTCHDIVLFARGRGILCQGRGAAANSAVCYCLEITAVDPEQIDLLFARFVSKERNEPPDIDIDFEHERREEVIQYIYTKYGREHAALTAEVVTYRKRSAVREVGKAMGLSLEIVDRLAKSIHHWTGAEITAEDLIEIGLDPEDVSIQNTLRLTNELKSFPRHLSQHVGGFIVSKSRLSETVPILNARMDARTIIEWDKDDIEALGILKIDILALGMLSCIRKALEYINKRRIHGDEPIVELHTIPSEDSQVYDMICAADTIGVFQIESRAQMSMLPRLRPRCFYDLVIEVALVRPGPIQGNMVHPYLKRRNGLEKAYYPDKRVEGILGKTLGVPIFQEQAMRLAIVLANFSPGEAEALRRAMSAWKHNKEIIATFKARIVKGMMANGYSNEFAETCMNQIKGFSEYGFPESHAASFAQLVYASAWIKKYYPAEFATALLNSQPMGFYSASQILNDAKSHGVKVNPVDINNSLWDCRLIKEEDTDSYSLQAGLRLVKGLQKNQARIITDAIGSYGKFTSISDLWGRTRKNGLGKGSLRLLARADAFTSLACNRREAAWQIHALPDEVYPLYKLTQTKPRAATLPQMSAQQEMFEDYSAMGFSLKNHPMGFLREKLSKLMVKPSSVLREEHSRLGNKRVRVAGLAIVRQRPGTAKGVVFITLEDEAGIVNLIIKPKVFEKYHQIILSSSCIIAEGIYQKTASADVVYIDAYKIRSLDDQIREMKKSKLPSKSYSY